MTTELQRAMARYEEARSRYQKAVLASLHGASNGDAIRQAIVAFQGANADLKRLSAPPAPPPPPRAAAQEESAISGWSYFLRLLKAG